MRRLPKCRCTPMMAGHSKARDNMTSSRCLSMSPWHFPWFAFCNASCEIMKSQGVSFKILVVGYGRQIDFATSSRVITCCNRFRDVHPNWIQLDVYDSGMFTVPHIVVIVVARACVLLLHVLLVPWQCKEFVGSTSRTFPLLLKRDEALTSMSRNAPNICACSNTL